MDVLDGGVILDEVNGVVVKLFIKYLNVDVDN